jgi:hypothetical protein
MKHMTNTNVLNVRSSVKPKRVRPEREKLHTLDNVFRGVLQSRCGENRAATPLAQRYAGPARHGRPGPPADSLSIPTMNATSSSTGSAPAGGGISRRRFLQVAGLSTVALSLPQPLWADASVHLPRGAVDLPPGPDVTSVRARIPILTRRLATLWGDVDDARSTAQQEALRAQIEQLTEELRDLGEQLRRSCRRPKRLAAVPRIT